MTTQIIFFCFIVSTYCAFLAFADGSELSQVTKSEQSKEIEKLVADKDPNKLKDYLVNIRNLATKQVSDAEYKLLSNRVQNDFITYLECAFQMWKPMLELVFQLFSPTSLGDTEIPSMPQDIVDLNEKFDQWMDDYDPESFPAPSISETPAESADTPLSTKSPSRDTKFFTRKFRKGLETAYKKWYYILTKAKNEFTNELNAELTNYAKHFQDFYKDKNIQVRFAACIARSYILSCTMHHRVLPDLRNYFEANPNADFVQTLFELIPDWYLDEETLLYFNILRSVVRNNKNLKRFFKKIGGSVSCLTVRNAEKKLVCIPYLESKECVKVDFSKHLTVTHRLYFLTPTTPLNPPLDSKA